MSEGRLPPTQPHEIWQNQETGSLPETGQAPPFPSAPPRPELAGPDGLYGLPPPGARLGDFDLLRILGSGSFARVYLARQLSLGRLVALKVSRNRGQEARTLAILEHDHIVRVFSESVDLERDFRLLCMQYVAGTTLERVIAELSRRPLAERNGGLLLDIVDRLVTDPAALDLGALRDRESLADMNLLEMACWMIARLAEALAHAHGQQVLHRDIKPANILVNRYGRPLLADFNIALAQANDAAGQVFGGTLAYMAPEHLDAFNSDDFTTPDAVDVRSDIYSLGVVLYELLTGRLPFELPRHFAGTTNEGLRWLADQRRAGPPRLDASLAAPAALERVVARCLAPLPSQRYQQAAELAADLDSCRELNRVNRELPHQLVLTRLVEPNPFVMGVPLLLLPHVLASVVNIAYNRVRIISELHSAEQVDTFWNLVAVYNSFAYPILVGVFISKVIPVYRAWHCLQGQGTLEATAVDQARQRVLALPGVMFWVAAIGWFPCGVVFPGLLSVLTEPVGLSVFGHYIFSSTISGLIAITYSVLATEYLAVRVFYPRLWLNARALPERAASELAHVESRLGMLQYLGVLIPLAGAALLVGVGPDGLKGQTYQTFRYLVTALLALGMAGLGLTLLV